MRTVKQLISNGKKVYVKLNNNAIGYRFLSDAQREGLTFSDGTELCTCMPDDVMAISVNGEISYLCWAGRIVYAHASDLIIKVDYEKYINEEQDYII